MLWLNIVAVFVLFFVPISWAGNWQVNPGVIGSPTGIVSSDGATASLEVRCQPDRQVTLIHPVLASMPIDDMGRLDWYQGGHISVGWGLDLTRPDHFGHLGVWELCLYRSDCVHLRYSDTESFIRQLRAGWSVFIRLSSPGFDVVDLRVSLVGSARVIDTVCPSLFFDK